MISRLKAIVRDALPRSIQVPLKYHLNRLHGDLEPEMGLLPYLVSAGDRVVDVGGNRGAYAFRLAQLGAKVEVFEPNPACYGVLQAWARGRQSVTVHPVGLSDHAGPIALHIPVDEAGVEHDASASMEPHAFSRTRDQVVELRTLDSFGFDGVKFIKIDVEGHETATLQGAMKTIQAWQPAVLVEVEQRHLQRPIHEVFALLLSRGYRGWFLDDAVLKSIETFDPDSDQQVQALGVRGQRYINNFLFLHESGLNKGLYQPILNSERHP